VILLSIEESEKQELVEHAEAGRAIFMPACSIDVPTPPLSGSSPKGLVVLANGVRGGFRNRCGFGVLGRGDSIGGGVDSQERLYS
jgi:hypothetical protein